jgi:ribosomal protein S12 methylthiotransferase
MGQRYGAGLLEQLPEVSGVLGVDWSGSMEKALAALAGGERLAAVGEPGMASLTRTVDSWGGATMLVRVADGCDRGCHFCAIPSIKGGLVSRPCEDICQEIERLSGGREREVLLLAQDLTSYGTDLPGDTNLTSLIRRVSEMECVRWLRLLYLQPEGVTEELIREVTGNPTICDYFDIPFQHASSVILRGMGRPGNASKYRELVSSIRKRCPRASIRTTVMVGYPGETEEDFRQLVGFVEDARFDWLGAFLFSPEEGTSAAGLPGAVGRDIAVSRYNTLLSIQDSIEEAGSDQNVGRELEVVVDSPDELEGYDFIGRSYREAPIVDGLIHLRHSGSDSGETKAGDFLVARIVGREGLDLVGEI